ncbi:hypothetical protein OHQ88_23235 [Micromonospora zamorensis]|uniref:Secreted protein n=1 Tax=Micromonospora zamorensis TaxID=709883 RepID=A0ABZ1PAJ0_9ACTN
MATGTKIVRNGIVALVLAGIGVTFAVVPAQAHSGSWSKTRSGCKYTGGVNSNHAYAWTQRETGSCSGHAWLWAISCDGGQIVHRSQFVSLSVPNMYLVYHKTQENEEWGSSHYAEAPC